ncbi:Bug family tripartite tricarboxylate transporter substrate binding protein [Pseudorhodoferax sp.]|uniref:Bug family tripartite tricarboxylate transporter substrate binding protein n=1 Tax=Pseudorhodoferax sp. TaxID=1993553 RepID=UPI002DD65CAC|nr:tripartite tricarboxylate transporter substrate binding protein [Pseudorhodoferax sp.]
MKFMRESLLRLLLGGLLLWQAPAWADWPNKPIQLVVGFPAGGLASNMARVLADRLGERLGQPVIVDNKTGAGGVIAFNFVRNARADGYTLLFGSNSTMTISPAMYAKPPFDSLKDFETIATAFLVDNVVVVRSDSPLKTFADFRAAAKASGQKINYGSAGIGTTFHLIPELYSKLDKVSMVHVPYRGGAAVLAGLLAGEVDIVFGGAETLPFIEAGRMRALAVLSPQRLKALPDVPTTAELGLPALSVRPFYGMLAPATTPKEIVDRINREVAAILKTPEVAQFARNVNSDVAPDPSRAYMTEQIRLESQRWEPLVKELGIKAE